ncbi:major intracellular serine protease precursor, putative [Perkinsus marinus ATCC 50983]|uniref:subtilisin n=1 Tax=Perkinsus marinus (strain ATCC 50983 / TXsc) TaxID=423536 RepID=C5LR84_PERM5|nr:major intracellular serine protease precursor, putative [Perkinsus marinus ATCC 50983]EER00759.1 major intracellular serine protease precursor, putative [Perkinsus marinus ATCC 50983]|eukprot:XP_002768041.1 major intracellular serine protease precursor, putative [Perkinsus marinus ATCC 50983]
MAGIIGAIRNNKIGIAGILNDVRILPISTGHAPGQLRAIEAFEYLMREMRGDVKVVLFALGREEPLPILMERIHAVVAAGMLVVLGAGNKHMDMDKVKYYPCSGRELLSEGVICVAGTKGAKMQLYDGSNFGSDVDIAAPGYRIFETDLGGLYGAGTGTSAAAAIVAGIAGMLYSLEPSVKTKLTPDYIKSIIMDTATKGVKDSKGKKTLSFGRVNAAAAVKKILGRKKV